MILDAMVVGLGAMGSATLYQLSKQTSHVLGIDQFAPPHTHGSTHGETRITRQAIGEGTHFVPLALRSYELWRELEQNTGENLLTITGGLFVGDAQYQTTRQPVWLFEASRVYDASGYWIAHRLLDTDSLRREFPQFRFRANDIGYYEDEAGFLNPERCISAQLAEAQRNGATIRTNERMLSMESKGDVVIVQTDQATYRTRKLILTTGSWITESLRNTPYQDLLRVHRQVLYWFAIESDYHLYTPDRMPVFILSDREVYGFPAISGPMGGLKLATEVYEQSTSPQTVNRLVSEAETQAMYEQHVAPNFVGIGPTCVKSVVCLYTMTPNGDFIIDQHPTYPNVLLASACSGHGFKHSAAVGQILAELALVGQTGFNIQPFQLAHFAGK